MVRNFDLEDDPSSDNSSEFQELSNPEGEPHLRFYVANNWEFALPAIGIKEVISMYPSMITPIPNASSLLLGTINLRGQVLWVADLGQFLGESIPYNLDRFEIPIVAIEDQEYILGLAVDTVEIDWLDIEEIKQVSNQIPDSMVPFLKGEWILEDENNHPLRLLDQVKILRSARWAA